MSINPADYEEVDIDYFTGYESARLGYPLGSNGNNTQYKKGWEDYHRVRESKCKESNIPYREPIRVT